MFSSDWAYPRRGRSPCPKRWPSVVRIRASLRGRGSTTCSSSCGSSRGTASHSTLSTSRVSQGYSAVQINMVKGCVIFAHLTLDQRSVNRIGSCTKRWVADMSHVWIQSIMEGREWSNRDVNAINLNFIARSFYATTCENCKFVFVSTLRKSCTCCGGELAKHIQTH